MKTILSLLILAGALLLASCENPMSFKTKVFEDGSLDKTIVLEKTEMERSVTNIFGINEATGWTVELIPAEIKSDSSVEKYIIKMSKRFSSVDEMNRELDTKYDTLFHVRSTFEKNFRWFYTYIRYAETIRPLNRFMTPSPDDYFNQEDHAFLDRLPGEGKTISMADSVYLDILNEKISERYVNMAMFNEINDIIKEVITKNNLEKRWLDTLDKKEETVYNIIKDKKGDHQLPKKIADSLGIPFPEPMASKDFEMLTSNLDNRIDFMSFSYYSSYVNEFELPWKIVHTNADSVAGKVAVWKPISAKFAFREYTMYAECRKMNLWAVIVSVLIVGLTVYLFIKKSKS